LCLHLDPDKPAKDLKGIPNYIVSYERGGWEYLYVDPSEHATGSREIQTCFDSDEKEMRALRIMPPLPVCLLLRRESRTCEMMVVVVRQAVERLGR
jgi:hypothetical protein